MSNRCIPITLCAATAIPFGLLGGFGPTGDHSIVPWLGFLAGWGACSYGRWQAVRLLRSAGRPVLRHRRPQSRARELLGVAGVEPAYAAEAFVLAANGRHHDSLPCINDNCGHEVIVAMFKVALAQ